MRYERSNNDGFIIFAFVIVGFIALVVMGVASFFGVGWETSIKFIGGVLLTVIIGVGLHFGGLLRMLWPWLSIGFLSSFFLILDDWSNSKYPFSIHGYSKPNPEWYSLWYSQIIMLAIAVEICYLIKKYFDENY